MKPWYRSRLIWVGLGCIGLGVVGFAADLLEGAGVLSAEWKDLIFVALGIVVTVLRAETTEGIAPLRKER